MYQVGEEFEEPVEWSGGADQERAGVMDLEEHQVWALTAHEVNETPPLHRGSDIMNLG